MDATNQKHADKVQELEKANDALKQAHTTALIQLNQDRQSDKNAALAELTKLKDDFEKRDAQYNKDLDDLNSKHQRYIHQLVHSHSQDILKRDEAHNSLNNTYKNDLS